MKKKIYLSLTLILSVVIIYAQIPNSGFETWTNMGSYNKPNSWSCLNDMTAPISVFTCEKGIPGNPGGSYIKLTSKTVTGMGVMPGLAVSGTFDQSTMQPVSGFAFNQRPANLTGSWQHMIFGSSQGYIDVQLTRWDGAMQMRMPVATAHFVLTGMAMMWSNFSIPLTYIDGNNPDSCIIILSASGNTPANNDYLYVDNLSFTGTVTGIDNVKNSEIISVYPNPVHDFIQLNHISEKGFTNYEIYSVNGELVQSGELPATHQIKIKNLVPSSYAVRLLNKNKQAVVNFIKY